MESTKQSCCLWKEGRSRTRCLSPSTATPKASTIDIWYGTSATEGPSLPGKHTSSRGNEAQLPTGKLQAPRIPRLGFRKSKRTAGPGEDFKPRGFSAFQVGDFLHPLHPARERADPGAGSVPPAGATAAPPLPAQLGSPRVGSSHPPTHPARQGRRGSLPAKGGGDTAGQGTVRGGSVPRMKVALKMGLPADTRVGKGRGLAARAGSQLPRRAPQPGPPRDPALP